MDYKFNGDFTLDDYVQMNKHIMKTKYSKIGWKIFHAFFGIIFVGMIVFNIIVSNNIYELLNFFVGIIWIPVFVIVYIFFMSFMVSKWRLRKYYDSNKIYNEPTTFEINENNILLRSESTNINMTKEKITKIEFDKDSIYIFTSLLTVLIIKQRFLKDENEYKELKELIIKCYK
ncbi:hypothetical protein AGMMS49579_22700 [Spirochaetia bacterium]|nr:hypothetical protein AGMMS49579_22700 [Spirochaetia bacterium]